MDEVFQSDYKARGARWAGTVDVPVVAEGAFVLEAGCGNGKTLSHLKHAVGVDISPEAVRLAGASRAVAGDIRALPFSDSVFDAVFCFHVLGHLCEADRRAAVLELFRVLKPGGVLYFRGFGVGDFRFGRGDEVEAGSFLRGDGIMTHYFCEGEVREVFGDGEVGVYSWPLRT